MTTTNHVVRKPVEYTINSTNPDNFNTITVNLPLPAYKFASVMVSSLITNCYIKVCRSDDYINFKVGDTEYNITMNSDYTSFSSATILSSTISTLLANTPISISVSGTNTLTFTCDDEFEISNMSYNMKILTGFYYETTYPIASSAATSGYSIQAKAVGYLLSTPMLYLISNLGDSHFNNTSNSIDRIQASSICMKILNSFTSTMPIISTNTEFSRIVMTTDLTKFELRLVDANMMDVELLNPMYISITITDATNEYNNDDISGYVFTRQANTEYRQYMSQIHYNQFRRFNDDFKIRFE